VNVKIVPQALYPEPTVRELTARPDAEETFARVARCCDDELVATLTSLAVLSKRAAAERLERGDA
jgi:hypothetical protein